MWVLGVSQIDNERPSRCTHSFQSHHNRGSECVSTNACLLAGARMHASQSAQRLGSSGDTSTSGRPSVDSESSSLAAGRQQQPLHPGMNAR